MSSTSLLKLFGLGTPVRSPLDVHPQDDGERHLGLENFGNTCYCNSVLQALYYCKPFRDCVIQFPQAALAKSPLLRNGTGPFNKSLPSADAQPEPSMNDTLFATLKDLFLEISTHRKKSTFVAPVNFINKVKKENELFRSSMHQDAHEFLNFLLNTIAEDVETFQKRQSSDSPVTSTGKTQPCLSQSLFSCPPDSDTSSAASGPHSSWVHQLFEGVFSNETKCLTCETVTSRDESFMDLSIDVEMNSSVTSCLRQFSASETLCHKNKYFCDECSGLQEAERRMKIKKLPNILALHLKRFKYQEQLQKYIKLTYRVVFPFELRLFNTCDDTDDADRLYELWACVIHIGSGPHHGHYVTIIKSNGQWLLFDDDEVTNIQEEDIQKYFSDLPGSGSGYVLFYQAINMEPIRMQDQETAVEHLPANAMPTLNGHHHDSTSMHHHFNPHHLGNKRDFAPPPAQPVSLPQHHHHHLADNLPIPAQSIHATESFSNTNGRSTTSSGRARHWNIGIKKKR